MKSRCFTTAMFLLATLAHTGCVMFDGADDFPQPCYGPDCMGGGLAQYGNAKYGHTGGYIGEPVFTTTPPVIYGGDPLPPGVTEVQLAPDDPMIRTKPADEAETPAPPNGVESIDIPTPPTPPTPKP